MAKITIKRPKRRNVSKKEKFMENFESWVGYWRENPHRFATEYLGLVLYDFQKVLIYMMFKFPNFIFVASRGLAKSTLSLIFSIIYCILYPEATIIVVAPTRAQSTRFVRKVYDLTRGRPNLNAEIDDVKTGINESIISFHNGSRIVTVPYSENALGQRGTILIIDEFVRTDKEVIAKVFVPMLTSPRTPLYLDLPRKERKALPQEPNHQKYLSSIRGADEWSYEYFLLYVDEMTNGNNSYMTVALPYHLGVKAGFISKATVQQSFKENKDDIETLLAEYLCRPIKSSGNSFFKYSSLSKRRNNNRVMVSMSDEQYLEYKDCKSDYPYYVEKFSNEIRLLTMDVALVDSSKNDNTAIWIIRLIPDNGKFRKIVSYAESIHGLNSLIQAKRAKQLFYEFDCDYFVLDAMSVGIGIFDICSAETYDENRGVTYPAWTVTNPKDFNMQNRVISPNAVPIIYSIKTGIREKSQILLRTRDLFATDFISLPSDVDDGIEYLDKHYKYYKIDDSNLRARLLNTYVQTSSFINEAINLEQIIVQGYLSAKEKSGRRKDRVMSLSYGIAVAAMLEEQLLQQEDFGLLDYIIF